MLDGEDDQAGDEGTDDGAADEQRERLQAGTAFGADEFLVVRNG